MNEKPLSAFPRPLYVISAHDGRDWKDAVDAVARAPVVDLGMTLRDYFAAAALTGIIAQLPLSERPNSKAYAAHAYVFADSMLAEREKS